jgi:SAM-dependent methyltransferase
MYGKDFFAAIERGSEASAHAVLPIVFAAVGTPRSLVDVGCGVGTWASVAKSLGVAEVVGVDGEYVSARQLHIAPDEFISHDLVEPLDLGRRFDLVVCMEVAEHLPASRGESFIEELAELGNVILFSAAIPGQGGVGHLNERPQSYWSDLFARSGLRTFDIVRRATWNDDQVEWWYRQNSLVYARSEVGDPPAILDIVHPRLFQRFHRPDPEPIGVRKLAGMVVPAVKASLRHHFRS